MKFIKDINFSSGVQLTVNAICTTMIVKDAFHFWTVDLKDDDSIFGEKKKLEDHALMLSQCLKYVYPVSA